MPVPMPAVDRLVLFVGRLLPHKNIHALIDGFSIWQRLIDNVGLAIVGSPADPPIPDRLIAEVNDLKAQISSVESLSFIMSRTEL